MPAIRYRLLNVFAETAFGGNPLAVVENAELLSDQEMQAVARQFNLSETTFLLPSRQAAARVRIFTPAYEMPFAGHPTLGSAHVVRELFAAGDRFELEMAAGCIPVTAQGDQWSFRAHAPAWRKLAIRDEDLAAMLQIPPSAVGAPAMWVNAGVEQAMIPLASVDDLRACRPNAELLGKFCTNASGQVKVYAFARTDQGFECRFFSGSDKTGINEDPATGSACANLGGWWLAVEGSRPLAARLDQGAHVKRPSVLTLEVSDGHIDVGGRVLAIGAGELRW